MAAAKREAPQPFYVSVEQGLRFAAPRGGAMLRAAAAGECLDERQSQAWGDFASHLSIRRSARSAIPDVRRSRVAARLASA